VADIYNDAGLIGMVLEGLTRDITGSLFFTFLLIVTFMVVIMLAFRIPIEFQALIIAPLLFTLMAFYQEWLAIGGVLAIFMGVLFARMIAKS
jgi:hypothetical protein